MSDTPRLVTEFKVVLSEYRLVHDGIKYQLHMNINGSNHATKRWVEAEDAVYVLCRRLEELSK